MRIPSHAQAEERLRRLLAENDLPMPDEVVHRPAEVVFLYHEQKLACVFEIGEPPSACYAVPRPMDVSVRELRNHTARVIAAVESGEPVVLTVHGRPVADIVPRHRRSERRPSAQLLSDLDDIRRLAGSLDVESAAEDFDVGLTTDDMGR
jgi:prevent-host-death family protein